MTQHHAQVFPPLHVRKFTNELPYKHIFMMPRFKPFQSTLDISKLGVAAKTKDDCRYDALRNLDSHSDSDTDVEDWEEAAHTQRRQRKRSTLWRRLRPYQWISNTALLLVIIGLLVEKRWESDKGQSYELAGDISGFAPTCTDPATGSTQR